jgi:hypothetical protein
MAHFAEIDSEGTVARVLVMDNTDIIDGDGTESESVGAALLQAHFGGTWKQTSYNTRGGEHLSGGEPLRKNYAGIGMTYDADRDAFIPPQPFESWVLDDGTCQWNPPVPMPDDAGVDKRYGWDEENLGWEVIPVPNPQDFKPLDESGGDK